MMNMIRNETTGVQWLQQRKEERRKEERRKEERRNKEERKKEETKKKSNERNNERKKMWSVLWLALVFVVRFGGSISVVRAFSFVCLFFCSFLAWAVKTC